MTERGIRPTDGLPPELWNLVELLAAEVHAEWVRLKRAEGWEFGAPDPQAHRHPDLVPYDELSEKAKDFDRASVVATMQALVRLGYDIVPRSGRIRIVARRGRKMLWWRPLAALLVVAASARSGAAMGRSRPRRQLTKLGRRPWPGLMTSRRAATASGAQAAPMRAQDDSRTAIVPARSTERGCCQGPIIGNVAYASIVALGKDEPRFPKERSCQPSAPTP